MQKTRDANNRGSALRALLVSLTAVSAYLLILQLSASTPTLAFCDTPTSYRATNDYVTQTASQDKPVEQDPDSINNAASIDFLCSADVRAQIIQMSDYERSGSWAEAVKLYQHLLTASTVGDCVASDSRPNTYVGLRRYLHSRVHKYPQEARKFYQISYASEAHRLLASALKHKSVDLLQGVADRYLLTDSGMVALDMLAAYARENGNFMEAVYYLERLEEFFPNAVVVGHLLRMVQCYTALNESARADAALARIENKFADVSVMVDGESINALEYARQLVKATAVPESDDEDWLVAGGDDSGQSQAGVLAKAGKSVWSQVMDVPNTHSTRYLAVKDNIVYVNSGRDISAYSLLDGRGPIWKFTLHSVLDGTRVGPNGTKDSATRRHYWPTAITIRGHRLYSAIFGVAFCLNTQTGERLWFAEMPESIGLKTSEERIRIFATAPLLINRNMYTCAVMQDLGTDDTYTLYCHDVLTGAMKWRQDFCQTSRIGSMTNTNVLIKAKSGFAMPAVLRKGRGMVYVSTNAGVLAAMDLHSGEVAWITRYDRGPSGNRVAMMPEKWAYGLPVVARGKIFVAPQDSVRMYAFDMRTGLPTWFVPRKSADGNRHYLVAVDVVSGLVFLGGNTLTAYDMDGKKVLGPINVVGGVIGAGVLAGRDIIMPTGKGLIRVAIDESRAAGNLKTTTMGDWESMLPGGRKFFEQAKSCSLVLVSNILLVESGKNLAAVYDLPDRKEVFLKELADAGENRNVSRLRVAEVLKVEGKVDEALKEFDRALTGLRTQAATVEHFDETEYLLHRGVEPSTLQYYADNLIRAREGLVDTAYSAALNLLGQDRAKINYQALYSNTIAPDKDRRILDYLKRASEYATTSRTYVDAQLVLLARGKAKQDWQGCVDLLMGMSSRTNAGAYDFGRYVPNEVITDVALFASEEIETLLRDKGRALYAKYEQAAEAMRLKARKSGRPADYFEIARRYPNSVLSRSALLRAINLAHGSKNYRSTVLYAQEFLLRYSNDISAISVMAYMAKGYAALGMGREAEYTLANMRSRASMLARVAATDVSKMTVEVGAKVYKIDKFAESLVPLIASTQQHNRSSFGPGVLKVTSPIETLSVSHMSQYALLVPEGCAPEGMENLIYMLRVTGGVSKAMLTCVERDTFAVVWKVVLPLEMGLEPDLRDYRAGYSGNNLVLVHRTGIMGLDPTDGSLHWKRKFSLKLPRGTRLKKHKTGIAETEGVHVRLGHRVIIDNLAVYLNVPSNPTRLYALNSRTGRLLWQVGVGGEVVSDMVLNGEALFVPVLRGKDKVGLAVVRRIDGQQMWRTEDIAFIPSGYTKEANPGFSADEQALHFIGDLSAYERPVEICDAGSAGVLMLSGEGLRLYKACSKLIWACDRNNIGRVNHLRRGGQDLIPGPLANRRILVGDGWCAVAVDEYARIKVYDLGSGKLLQNISTPHGWWLSDWMSDGKRLHIFTHAKDNEDKTVSAASCFDVNSGRMLYENIIQTGQFQYRPIVTRDHIVFIRGYKHSKNDKMARVYVYDKITGKIVVNPVRIQDMDCDQNSQAIDTRSCILVKGRSKMLSLHITSKGN